MRGVDVDRSSALQDVASTAKEQSFLFYYIISGDSWRGGSPPLGEWRWVGKGACGGFTFDKCVYRKSWL